MKKIGFAALAVSICIVLAVVALAEGAVPSINIGAIVVPGNVAVNDTLTVYVAPVAENRVEAKVFKDIVKTAEETSVKEYFGEEVMKSVVEAIPAETLIKALSNEVLVEVLPREVLEDVLAGSIGNIDLTTVFEEVDTSIIVENIDIQVDEFFSLNEEGYESGYGDLVITFEFATQYEDDAVLVAVVGILPEDCKVDYDEDEELEEGLEIEWIAVPTTVSEGCVNVKMTEEILSIVSERSTVFALLNINGEHVEAVEDMNAEETEE